MSRPAGLRSACCRACARLPPRSAEHVRQFEEISLQPPTWWKPVNEALADMLALALALVGKVRLLADAAFAYSPDRSA